MIDQNAWTCLLRLPSRRLLVIAVVRHLKLWIWGWGACPLARVYGFGPILIIVVTTGVSSVSSADQGVPALLAGIRRVQTLFNISPSEVKP